ncbi:MAG: exodeoxyribonuclease III [Panacagrimonas sp.]
MRIGTWNVNSLRVRMQHLNDWLATDPVDVLGVQEIKMQNEQFPHEALQAAGWKAVSNGQKTYNGVALMARQDIEDVVMDIPGFDDEQKRVIAGTVGGVRVICVYVVNGQSVGSEKFAYKLRWLDALCEYVHQVLGTHDKVAIVGDYNIAPRAEDTHDAQKWEGGILCSDQERARLQRLLDLGLSDCFDAKPPEGNRFTWWDYRQAAFRRNLGLRIDHVLASQPLVAKLDRLQIDLTPRKLERPSDHTPVIAHFKL